MPTTAPPPRPAGPGSVPRRAVLAAGTAGAALALTGCRFGGDGPAPGPDPLAPVLTGVRDLLARYDEALAAAPDLADRLKPLRADTEAHARALARAIGGPSATPPGPSRAAAPTGAGPSGGASPTGPDDSTGPDGGASPDPGTPTDPTVLLAGLRAAEQAAQAATVTACLAAPGRHAALLASVAACRATHVEVLR